MTRNFLTTWLNVRRRPQLPAIANTSIVRTALRLAGSVTWAILRFAGLAARDADRRIVEIGRRSKNTIPYRIVQVVLTGVLVAAFVITLEPKAAREDAGQSEMASIPTNFVSPLTLTNRRGVVERQAR